MPKAYFFDCDECLSVSNGPIDPKEMLKLKEEGHCVGICGNGRKFCNSVPNWWNYISVTLNLDLGPFAGFQGMFPKYVWLQCFKDMYSHFEEYILVGNEFGRVNSLGFKCGSADGENARIANFRFILEDDFANGVR